MKRLFSWYMLMPLALIIALAVGWVLPPPPLPKIPEAVEESWQLPAGAQGRESIGITALNGIRFDGENADGNTGPQGPWRLAGIVSGPIALIELLSSKEILRLAPDEALPDGQMLRKIFQDRIQTEQKDCFRVYQLYRPEPLSTQGSGCPEEKPAETAPKTS